MALFFNRISKLCTQTRFFSSLPQSPYLLLGGKLLRESPEGKVGKHRFFDPTTQERVYSGEKTTPKELNGQPLLGTSQESSLCLPSGSNPRRTPRRCLSLLPDPVQDDFIVAAKFSEYQLSVCRPRWDSKWTHIDTPFSLLPPSDLMYSKRDKAFYFTSFKGLYMGSLDLSENELEFQELTLRNQPKNPEAGWEMLDKCFMSKHLVESPSGELFFIKWYTLCIRREEEDGESTIMHSVTKRFMVFREDEKRKDFCYTEDIGDLCIFLGRSEAFCVKASMYPGLKPNSIYYIGVSGLGFYDLASGTVRSFDTPAGRPLLVPYPYWLRPTNPIA
ncbi:unnamed protein product [Microthlaspi erraticum]|uniref:KIB1-4 beta-propeller domain-containing protein n=1 Tax=Microthlaspi erraticum TaxID=1685480 RepID=A0A6D2LBT0_9BRAS|nr:unnamed protein product [Microthlaspi erraticum]